MQLIICLTVIFGKPRDLLFKYLSTRFENLLVLGLKLVYRYFLSGKSRPQKYYPSAVYVHTSMHTQHSGPYHKSLYRPYVPFTNLWYVWYVF